MNISSPDRRQTETANKPIFNILRLVESSRTTTQKTLANDNDPLMSDSMRNYCRELAFRYHGNLSRVAEELEVPMSWVASVASKFGLTEGCPRIAKQEEEALSD
jgi:hypothetical protein